MNATILVFLCFASHLFGQSLTPSRSPLILGGGAMPSPDPSQPRFYLHFLTPAYYNGTDDGSTPPKRILTVEVHPPQDIFVAVGGDASTLRGRIEPHSGGFRVHLQGTYSPSTGIFDGDLELEKPVIPQSYVFSGAIMMVVFVLSTNSDCEPFLKQQAAHDEEITRQAQPK